MNFVGLIQILICSLTTLVSSLPHQQEKDSAAVGAENFIYGQILEVTISMPHIEHRNDILAFEPYKNSVVNANNFQISFQRNESVEGIMLFNQYVERDEGKKFLLVKVDEIFPNLILYDHDKCAVESVTKDNFKKLTKLLVVSLSYNNIKTIDEDSFNDLTSLRELNLMENKIETLPDKIFQNLHELKSLYLGGNPIVVLNDQHFQNNDKLEYLGLPSTQIKSLSPTMFDSMKTLRTVNLASGVCIDKNYYAGDDEAAYFSEYLIEFKNDVIANCSFKF